MMKFTAHIGRSVRLVRRHRSWSRTALALHLGVKASHLADVEEGRCAPSDDLHVKLLYWMHGEEGVERIVRRLVRSVYDEEVPGPQNV